MLNELSGKIMFWVSLDIFSSNIPVCHVAGLGFLPGAGELGESGVVEDACDGCVDLLPDLVKRVRGDALGLLVVFDERTHHEVDVPIVRFLFAKVLEHLFIDGNIACTRFQTTSNLLMTRNRAEMWCEVQHDD